MKTDDTTRKNANKKFLSTLGSVLSLRSEKELFLISNAYSETNGSKAIVRARLIAIVNLR